MDELSIAVFIDFENLALGVRDMKGAEAFRIELVLNRLLEKGRVVYKRAYCDWSNYRQDVREFHSHGIELIDIPQTKMSGKNSADIRMVVDAIDLCHTKENIDTFALVSGDSDFSPLVAKLKENNKRVIACGIRSSTSQLLVANCDEFIYYDDLVKIAGGESGIAAKKRGKTPRKAAEKQEPKGKRKAQRKSRKEDPQAVDENTEALLRVMEIIRSLQADYDPLWGSLIKQTVRRVLPGFREEHYGYQTFVQLLEEIASRGLIELEHDQSRGNYKVSLVST